MNQIGSKNLDFGAMAKKWQDWWEKEDIYNFDPFSEKPVYSIDTPPPTVSGLLHVGHAMSYTQADFIARYKRMRGFNVFYPMGFDDNGLPTERYVEGKLGIDLKKMSPKDFNEVVKSEVSKAREDYKSTWKGLGISVDWNRSYSTISQDAVEAAQRSFVKLYKNGRVYRKNDAAIWCPTCETSLAQADLETKEESSKLNFIKFDLGGKKVEIATTRPEMLGSCVAVFVNPSDEKYVSLIGKNLTVPIYNNNVTMMADSSVDKNFGTGAVMISTFGDRSDVDFWRNYNLPSKIILGKDGRLNEQAGKYKGLSVLEARRKIIEDLFAQDMIVKQEDISHNIPIHERCEKPVQFNIRSQWFVKMLDLKDKMIEQGEKIQWYPANMKNVYETWVNGIKWDWNISRQRPYGVPFPVWYCNECEVPNIADESKLPIDPRTSDYGGSCSSCGSINLLPDTDVMDTWMTSSITPLINAHWGREDNLIEKIYPMSLRPQAHEIIRTWAYYTILKNYLHEKSVPWNAIMISGHGLDSYGKKMSKSRGNIILPEDVIKNYSVDGLRWWASGIKLGENLPFQEKDVVRGKNLVNKLWNAGRFASEYIADGKAEYIDNLKVSDKWILTNMNETIRLSTNDFEIYQYSNAKSSIESFFWHDFCDNYMEIIKHRLRGENEESRKNAQRTLYDVMLNSVKLIAPFMPHITEEIYQNLFRKHEGVRSVHLSEWPRYKPELKNDEAKSLGDLEIGTISLLRNWKREQNLSLAVPIARLRLHHPEASRLKQLEDEIRGTMRIGELKIKEGDISIETY